MVKRVVIAMQWLRRHPIVRALIYGTASLIGTMFVVLIISVVALKSRDFRLPQKIADSIVERINTVFDQVDIQFDHIAIGISDELHPYVIFQKLKIGRPNTPAFAEFAEIEAEFSPDGLVKGNFRVSQLRLNGANLAMKRDLDGAVSLRFGEFDQQGTDNLGLQELLFGIDQTLLSDELSKFERFDMFGLTVQYDDLRSNKSYLVDGVTWSILRDQNTLKIRSDLALLTGGADVATLEVNYSSELGKNAADFGIVVADVPAQDIASQTPILAWLAPLNAPISGAFRGGWDQDLNLLPLNGTLQIGAGQLQPTATVRPISFDKARTYFSFDPKIQSINFDEISVSAPELDIVANGYADLSLDAGSAQGFVGQLKITKFDANPQALFLQPVSLSNAKFDLRLTLAPFLVELENIYVQDNQSTVSATGSATIGALASGWSVGFDVFTPKISSEVVETYWPVSFKEKSREWVTENIETTDLTDVSFALRAKNQEKPETYLGFGFESTTFKALKEFPKITQGSGVFEAFDHQLTVRLDRGVIKTPTQETLVLKDSVFQIPDVRIKPSPAKIDLGFDGPVTAALWVLNHPPINVLERINKPKNFVQGHTRGKAHFDVVLKKGLKSDEISYAVAADLFQLKSKDLVPKRNFSSDKLSLEITENVLKIFGPAQINGVDLSGDFSANLTKDAGIAPKITAQASISPKDIQSLGIGFPVSLLRGSSSVDMKITLPKGRAPEYQLKSDLVGMSVAIPALGWSKPAKKSAQLTIAGKFDKTNALDAVSFTGPGLSFTGRGAFTDAKFQKFEAQGVKFLGAFSGDLTVSKNGKISVSGGRANLSALLSRMPKSKSNSAASQTPLSITLDRLDLTDRFFITKFSGDILANGQGKFSGLLNGIGQINGTLAKQKSGYRINVTSLNAGNFLKSTALIQDAVGGDLILELLPRDSGAMDGSLSIRDVRINNAPVLFELLNTLSIVGVLDQLRGAGLLFSEVDAKFRISKDQVIIENATAFGPSVGVSLNGYVYSKAKVMDIQGVLSPLYLLNGIGSIFTQKGEGLLGFNFNLSGNIDKPSVAVNPMSILTPSVFRNIFRRPPPVLEPQ